MRKFRPAEVRRRAGRIFTLWVVSLLIGEALSSPIFSLEESPQEPSRAMNSSESENSGVREGDRPSSSSKEDRREGTLGSVPRAREESPRAMWVWDARTVTEPKATNELLHFCHRRSITTLYLSAYNLQPPLEEAYRNFNRQAHQAGITVYALAGDPRWGQTRYHAVPLQWVDSVCEFNNRFKPEERFDGIHTDVEVYLLSKSWAERPAELLGGYLDLNAKIADKIHALPKPKNRSPTEKPFLFGVDLPFWFDDDTSYRILWHGLVKLPTQHVLDTVDTITVMAYRNFAEGSDGTIHLVSLELNYADQIGKKVVIGQETQEDLFPSYVTFGGTSCAKMRQELEKIQTVVGHRPSFGGFAFHHYESYRKLCSD